MKKKVVYNESHGGFSLSKLAAMWLASRGLEEAIVWLAEIESDPSRSDWDRSFYPWSLTRHSSLLLECVLELGDRAGSPASKLAVAEVEDLYRIEEYDGLETVVQPGDIHWTSAIKDPEILEGSSR